MSNGFSFLLTIYGHSVNGISMTGLTILIHSIGIIEPKLTRIYNFLSFIFIQVSKRNLLCYKNFLNLHGKLVLFNTNFKFLS